MKESIRIAVSENLKAIQQATGITIPELNISTSISVQTLTNLFKGSVTPNRSTLWKLSVALGCSPHWLISNWPAAQRFDSATPGAPSLEETRTALAESVASIKKRARAAAAVKTQAKAQRILAGQTAPSRGGGGGGLEISPLIAPPRGRPKDPAAVQARLAMGERLQTLLIYGGKKLTYLCHAGITHEGARKLTRGITYPSPNTLNALASLFGITIAQLEGHAPIDPERIAVSVAAISEGLEAQKRNTFRVGNKAG